MGPVSSDILWTPLNIQKDLLGQEKRLHFQYTVHFFFTLGRARWRGHIDINIMMTVLVVYKQKRPFMATASLGVRAKRGKKNFFDVGYFGERGILGTTIILTPSVGRENPICSRSTFFCSPPNIAA